MFPRRQILKLKLAAMLGLNASFDADCDAPPALSIRRGGFPHHPSGTSLLYRQALGLQARENKKRSGRTFTLFAFNEEEKSSLPDNLARKPEGSAPEC